MRVMACQVCKSLGFDPRTIFFLRNERGEWGEIPPRAGVANLLCLRLALNGLEHKARTEQGEGGQLAEGPSAPPGWKPLVSRRTWLFSHGAAEGRL